LSKDYSRKKTNKMLKFALFKLAQIPFSDEKLQRMAQQLFRYFESVSLISTEAQIPAISYTRLNEHYQPIVNLATLIIKRSTENLEKPGEVWFCSFLVDMNVLFERFLRNYLKKNANHTFDK